MRIAVVEDEQAEQERLLAYLERFQKEEPSIPLETVAYQAPQEFRAAYDGNFDLLFLDIYMPHMSGMELARQIRSSDPDVLIVFITNLQQYAIEGYSVDAMDFAVKPLKYGRLVSILKKAAKRVEAAGRKIFLGGAGNLRGVLLSDLLYVEVMQHTLLYHLKGETVKVHGSLKQAEQELGRAQGFVKCNSCYLVNLAHVEAVDGNFVTVGGDRLLVSARRRSELLRSVAEYRGGR